MPRRGGQLLHRLRHSQRRPPTKEQRQHDPDAARDQRHLPDEALHFHQFPPRAAHQQNAQQFAGAPLQRQRMKSFRACGICRPLHGIGSFCWPLPHAVNQRRKLFRLRNLPGAARKQRRIEIWFEIAIEQRAHAFGQHQRIQKFIVQRLPAGDENLFLAHAHAPHRREHHRAARRFLNRAIAIFNGKFFAPQEGAFVGPLHRWVRPFRLQAETRRPMRGGKNHAVGIREFNKRQLMRARQSARIVHVKRIIRLRRGQIDSHAHGGFRICDALHAARDHFAARRKFPPELLHQRGIALRFELFKARTDAPGNRPRHEPRGKHNC